MNMVERFFAEITTRRIRRGSYGSVDDLERAIYDYLILHNMCNRPKRKRDFLNWSWRVIGC